MKTIRGLLILFCVGFFALGAAATSSYAQGECGPWNNFCGDGPGPGWGQECGPWNNFCRGPMPGKHKKKCGPWNNFCHQGGGMGGGGMGGDDDGGMQQGDTQPDGGGMGDEGGGPVGMGGKKEGGGTTTGDAGSQGKKKICKNLTGDETQKSFSQACVKDHKGKTQTLCANQRCCCHYTE